MALREATLEETAHVWRMTDVDDPAHDEKRAQSVYVTDTDTQMTDIAESIAGRLEVQLFAPRGEGLTRGQALASSIRLGLELVRLADEKWPNHSFIWTMRFNAMPEVDAIFQAQMVASLQPFITEVSPDVWEGSAEAGRQYRQTRLQGPPS